MYRKTSCQVVRCVGGIKVPLYERTGTTSTFKKSQGCIFRCVFNMLTLPKEMQGWGMIEVTGILSVLVLSIFGPITDLIKVQREV